VRDYVGKRLGKKGKLSLDVGSRGLPGSLEPKRRKRAGVTFNSAEKEQHNLKKYAFKQRPKILSLTSPSWTTEKTTCLGGKRGTSERNPKRSLSFHLESPLVKQHPHKAGDTPGLRKNTDPVNQVTEIVIADKGDRKEGL